MLSILRSQARSLKISDTGDEEKLRKSILNKIKDIGEGEIDLDTCVGFYDSEEEMCLECEDSDKCKKETKLREEISQETDNSNIMEESEMTEKNRRRRRPKEEEVILEEEVEFEDEDIEIEDDDYSDDEEEIEEVEVKEEKPKKKQSSKSGVRKPREKKLKFVDNCPSFITQIRDISTAITAINDRRVLIGKNQYEVGHLLYHIKVNKLFAPTYKSFTQFCQSQEVGYSPAQAANLMNVVKVFDRETIEHHGTTKLLPLTRLKDKSEAKKILKQLDSGELTDVKSVEKAVKEQISYPHTPTRTTDAARVKMEKRDEKGIKGLLNKSIKLYMIDDDDEELKSADAVKNARDPHFYIPLAEGIALKLKSTDGVLWVARFIAQE